MANLRLSGGALLVFLVACGSNAATVAGTDAAAEQAADGHADASDAVPPPDDGGICCPPDPTLSCCLRFGGWSATGSSCRQACDGIPAPTDPSWHLSTDEHGCSTWTHGSASSGPLCGLPDADGSPSTDATTDATEDSQETGAVPREGGACNSTASGSCGGGAFTCGTAADCRTFSNYCGGCLCEVLGASKPNPTCDAGTVSCLVDPCMGHTAACDPSGRCVLR